MQKGAIYVYFRPLSSGWNVTPVAPGDRCSDSSHDLVVANSDTLSSRATTSHLAIRHDLHYDLHRRIPTSHSGPNREHVVDLRLIEAGHCPRDMRHGVREQDPLMGSY